MAQEGQSTRTNGEGTAEETARRQKARQNSAKAVEHEPLNAPTVYEVISADGVHEMERPATSLWWAGVGAGFGISLSLYMQAALRVSMGDMPGAYTLEKFGYSFGFLIVVLGHLQLFTENTITPILPLLREKTMAALKCVARLWAIVFAANLVGTFICAALPILFPIASEAQTEAIFDISRHFAHKGTVEIFYTAIPAGFLVAAMVWMLPSSKGFEFWTILLITFGIAVAELSHVVVGSTELFTVIMLGELGIAEGLLKLAAAGLGNIIGGTGLFAILAYAQVSEEL